jgi:acyl carrier protein
MTHTEKLHGVLAKLKEEALNKDEIKPGHRLREDLSFSSFDFLELVGTLEQEFAITFDSSDFNSQNFETVQSLETLVLGKLEVVNPV